MSAEQTKGKPRSTANARDRHPRRPWPDAIPHHVVRDATSDALDARRSRVPEGLVRIVRLHYAGAVRQSQGASERTYEEGCSSLRVRVSSTPRPVSRVVVLPSLAISCTTFDLS